METVVTSRIDSDLKDRVVSILRSKGLTASDAIRQMFEQVAMGNTSQLMEENRVNALEAKQKIARLDAIYVHGFENATDEDLRKTRLEERYATISGH